MCEKRLSFRLLRLPSATDSEDLVVVVVVPDLGVATDMEGTAEAFESKGQNRSASSWPVSAGRSGDSAESQLGLALAGISVKDERTLCLRSAAVDDG